MQNSATIKVTGTNIIEGAATATVTSLSIATWQGYVNLIAGVLSVVLTLVLTWYWIRKGLREEKRTNEEMIAEILENPELLELLKSRLTDDDKKQD